MLVFTVIVCILDNRKTSQSGHPLCDLQKSWFEVISIHRKGIRQVPLCSSTHRNSFSFFSLFHVPFFWCSLNLYLFLYLFPFSSIPHHMLVLHPTTRGQQFHKSPPGGWRCCTTYMPIFSANSNLIRTNHQRQRVCSGCQGRWSCYLLIFLATFFMTFDLDVGEQTSPTGWSNT